MTINWPLACNSSSRDRIADSLYVGCANTPGVTWPKPSHSSSSRKSSRSFLSAGGTMTTVHKPSQSWGGAP
jgi:hypothetical protein